MQILGFFSSSWDNFTRIMPVWVPVAYLKELETSALL